MKSNNFLIITTAMSLTILSLASCQKNAPDHEATDQALMTMSEEQVSADLAFDDLTDISLAAGTDLETTDLSNDEVITNSITPGVVTSGLRLDLFTELRYKTGPCTKLEVAPLGPSFPKTVTVDYGNGCVCKDAKFRKGTVVMVFSAPIRKYGATVNISSNDYFVNKVLIEGSKTITNLSSNGVIKYAVKVDNSKLTFPNGRGLSHTEDRTITQTGGAQTWLLSDDSYSVEGIANTVHSNGFEVTKSTESPVIKRVNCGWFVQGKLKIEFNNKRVVHIDFGGGECDNKAILSWSKGQKEITLQ